MSNAYLRAGGFILILAMIAAVGGIVGDTACDVFQSYADQLACLSSPAGYSP